MRRDSSGSPADAAPLSDDVLPSNGRRGPRPSTDVPPDPVNPRHSDAPGLPEEDPLVLDEIDRIISELQTRRDGGNGPPGSSPWAPPYPGSSVTLGPGTRAAFEGSPSGYFEAHLGAARRAMGNIHEKVGELADTSSLLRQRVAAAEKELERISQEYEFVRDRWVGASSTGGVGSSSPLWWEGEPEPTAATPGGAQVSSGSFTAIQAATADGPSPVYAAFTVGRYNRTIDSLKGGRARLVAWTLVLSAVVGVALVLVMLFSPIVYPPIWIAVLPLVWVVPIPYFLLAFRGTQRVVERSHLHLPEAR